MRRDERDVSVHKGYTGTLRWMAPEVLGTFMAYTEKVRERERWTERESEGEREGGRERTEERERKRSEE